MSNSIRDIRRRIRTKPKLHTYCDSEHIVDQLRKDIRFLLRSLERATRGQHYIKAHHE